jgi:hypothetical protein
MTYPFPGMDPYLEHPALWESFHARLVVALANQLQPLLDPRYVASVEQRVFVEGPQQRIPDVLIRQVTPADEAAVAVMEPRSAQVTVVEVDPLEVRETRIEILDTYRDLKIVTLIEVLSPSNKTPGPGRESYLAKQQETLASDVHLVEIDLLRRGQHTVAVPEWRMAHLTEYTYLTCVSRWPKRHRFELYRARLQERLPDVSVPLVAPDADALLSIQDAIQQVYAEGRYDRWLKYRAPCEPPLSVDDQTWAARLLHLGNGHSVETATAN